MITHSSRVAHPYAKVIGIFALCAAIAGGFFMYNILTVQAAVVTWDGGGADGTCGGGVGDGNKWSCGANWSGDVAPGVGDIATFNGTSTKDATIDAAISVAGINIEAGYSGTITQAATVTVGTSDYVQAAGTFTGATQLITMNDDFTMTGGTFTSTSGTLDLNGIFNISAGGTFTHNSGTVTFTSTNTETIDVGVGGADFNNLTINTVGGLNDYIVLDDGDTLRAAGAITLTNGAIFGENTTLEANGTVASPIATWDGGTTVLEVNCACAITNSGTNMMGLRLNNVGASYTNSNGTVQTLSYVIVEDGTFNAGVNSTYIYRDLSVSATGIFNDDAGTVRILTSAIHPINLAANELDSYDQFTHNIDGDITFNNLTLQMQRGDIFRFHAGDTIDVSGDFVTDVPAINGLKYYIESDAPGSQFTFNFASDTTLTDVSFKDVNLGNASVVTCIERCIDAGNNDSAMTIDQKEFTTMTDASSLTVDESGTTSIFTIRPDARPTANVVITFTNSDATEVAVSPDTLTFTTANYYTPQTVTLTGVDDADDDGPQEVTITLNSNSLDLDYDDFPIDVRTVVNMDNDTPADTIDFDDPADYQAQDVRGTASDVIENFDPDGFSYGMGYFEDSLSAAVDLSGSEIQSGCIATIAGEDYQIISILDEAAGFVHITPIPPVDPYPNLDDDPITGAVTRIVCTGAPDETNAGGLSQGFVNSRMFASVGDASDFDDGFTYDSINDVIWSVDANTGDLVRTNNATGATSSLTTTNPPIQGPKAAVDSAGILWMPSTDTDEIVAVDGATGTFAFGTEGASTFATTTDRPMNIEYDPERDIIWVLGDGANMALDQFDPTDGSLIDSTDLSSLGQVDWDQAGLVFDSVNDALWVSLDDNENVLKIDATDGLAYDTDFATSTYSSGINSDFFDNTELQYNATLDEVYVKANGCNNSRTNSVSYSELAILDASDGSYKSHVPLSECPYQMSFNDAGDTLYVSGETGEIFVTDVASRTSDILYMPADISFGVVVDNEGDVWMGDNFNNENLWEYVVDGVPTDVYYTVTTLDASQLDSTGETGLETVTVDESLDGQSIYYALSFDDRASFVTWNSPAEVIASSDVADHGGVDGDWYYKDGGGVWQVDPGNSANTALSLAQSFAANQMTGAELSALTDADFNDVNGFEDGVTTTIDLAATFFSDDAHDAPQVNDVAFAFAGGGGGGGGGGGDDNNENPSGSIVIDGSAACTVDTSVTLTLTGTNADDMRIGNLADLSDAVWEPFAASKDWTLLSTDGEQSVYVQFRSEDGNTSAVYSDTIVLDAAGSCEDIPEEPPVEEPPIDDESDDDPIKPNIPGIPEDIDVDDYIKTGDDDTVYIVTKDGYRPFKDFQTYLTYAVSCRVIKYVEDGVITVAHIGPGMMPNPGTTMVMLPGDNRVYTVEKHPTDDDLVRLRWITSESIAREAYGEHWADYVISIEPDPGTYDLGEPITSASQAPSGENFRSRAALNNEVRYDIYIVNPDGTRRFSFDDAWTRMVPDTDGTILYQFEDKGEDMDFNDVVLRVDARNCLSFGFYALPLEAAWHHMIGVQIYFNGEVQDDVIISEDSHDTVNKLTVVDVTNVDKFTPYEVYTQEEGAEQGYRTSGILGRLGATFRSLLNVLTP